MSLIQRLVQFRAGQVIASALCPNPYEADTWQGWFSVQPGDVIFELDDTLDMVDFHRIADGRELPIEEVQALTGGHVVTIPDDAAPAPDHELMYRKRGRSDAGKLVNRYMRKEDETDMALMKRRARGENVPAIPADAELPITLERKREIVKSRAPR